VANSLSASLGRFPFPAEVVPAASRLIRADDALVELGAEQARSSSLTQLRSFDDQVQVASVAVQTDLQLVGRALSKPPTASEEP